MESYDRKTPGQNIDASDSSETSQQGVYNKPVLNLLGSISELTAAGVSNDCDAVGGSAAGTNCCHGTGSQC